MHKSGNPNAQAAADAKSSDRRNFMKFLAASPYVASIGGVGAIIEQSALGQGPPAAQATNPDAAAIAAHLITDPAQALDVFDFEEVAHGKVMQGHWAYMVSGVD